MRRSLANYIHIFEALCRRPTAGRKKCAKMPLFLPRAAGWWPTGATFRRANDKAQRSIHVNRL